MAIHTIEDLRLDAIDTLEKLRNRKMEVEEAGVIGKVYETIISTVKTQLAYADMIGVEPRIAFMGGMNKGQVINMKGSIRALGAPKQKKKIKRLK